ncbi:unnamed protein product [Porites lobata]|uniref:Metalloendopeptidase n=1 Tax=Porites lobata TaxID=104759 RepID=A0ABN8N5H7_9CNID|nr:unnamed protein product [Porites lobata]
MMFEKAQIRAAENGLDPTKMARAQGLNRRGQWPGGVVPFTIHSSAKNKVLNALGIRGPTERAIYRGMEKWEENTCIRFVHRTTQKDYVEFSCGDGRWSYVGCQNSGKQIVSVGKFCFFQGIVVHEIGHTLGLLHEMSRPDRDEYVDIVWNNIKEEQWYNFKKYGHGYIHSLGLPYDYESIMHYGKREFAKWPWQTTIRPKKTGVSIGQRRHLSPHDVEKVNRYYSCEK